jgi:hypothetical protein
MINGLYLVVCASSTLVQFYVEHDTLLAALRNRIKATQDYMQHNTTPGILALFQTEEAYRLRFGNTTVSAHQLGTYARGKLSGSRKWVLQGLVTPVVWVSIKTYAPLGDLARELRCRLVEEICEEEGSAGGWSRAYHS